MKRIIYFVLVILVCGIYVGCSENEIDLYDQTPRINFYVNTHVRTLVDTDYVKKCYRQFYGKNTRRSFERES